MGSFNVILLSQALKFYKNCSLELANRLDRCFEELEVNPFWGSNIKLLKTKKKLRLYRYRLDAYRIIYEIDKEGKQVGILLISLRKSAYRRF